jgi:hypothetical protein
MIVYTASIGGRAYAPNRRWAGCDMIAFGDATPPASWESRQFPDLGDLDRNTRAARRIKVLPWEVLGQDWDACLWIDANFQLMSDPRTITGDMAAHRHRDRDCVYAEAEICARVAKDDPALLLQQTGRYRQNGYPERAGLWETQMVYRRNTPAVRALCEDWWREIETGSRRDQVSLPVAASRHPIIIHSLGDNAWKSTWARRHRK